MKSQKYANVYIVLMKQKVEAISLPKQGIRGTGRAVIAAGVLQGREPKRRELRAIHKIGEAAHKSFRTEHIKPVNLAYLGEMYKSTAYWHGTGRFQRRGGEQVDVLAAIIKNKAINPSLDPFDPELGLARTTSLSVPRLYARAYADMHSDRAGILNRLVSAQTAANFYIIRPTLRYMMTQGWAHPDGLTAGVKELRATSIANQKAMPQSWKSKVTNQPVSTMKVFSAGSDIPGNYPILFGMDEKIKLIDTSSAIRETREVRTDDPITLDRLTHVEVPREKVEEVSRLFQANEVTVPVLAIEDMEQYVARQDIGAVLMGEEFSSR